MSVENFITRFVYKHKEIALQGLGIIKLEDAVPDNDYINKHKFVPIEQLHFEHLPQVETTPSFVTFYSEMRGKIVSLAENDIEAFLSMTLQFLNIGNPVEFKGLGVINKQKDGKLIMTASHFLALKEEDAVNRFKDRQPEAEEPSKTNFFGEKKQQSAPLAKVLMGAGIALLIALGAWWLYSSFIKNPSDATNTTDADSVIANQEIVTPPSALAADSSQATNNANVPDSLQVLNWKAIIREESNKQLALAAWENNYKKMASRVVMETADSVYFKFYVVLPSSLKDLNYKRDSVARFFARSIRIEPLQ